MVLFISGDFLIFSTLCFGPGLLFATFFRGFRTLDRLSLGLGAAVISLYLISFAIYLLSLPPAALWAAALAGFAASLIRHRALRELWQDKAAQRAFLHWPILAAWCLGWQALVLSYSGGGWSGDWQEHYDRVHFFLQHWPTNHQFIDMYPVPARPPLANLVIGGWLGLAGGKFFHFQIFSTLLATLVFFPLAGLVQRLRPEPRAQSILLGLLMLSPIFMQNATFPWTKLPAAYFVVLAADLLARQPVTPPRCLTFALIALAAALLTHYSAAVWIAALGIAWLVQRRAQFSEPANRRSLLLGAALGSLLFMTWLGWSLSTYGAHVTFTANTSSGLAPAMTAMERLRSAVGNTYHTLVPAWLWEGLPPLLQQESLFARLRDRWFCLYQLNLPLAFGLGGVLVLGRLLLKHASHDGGTTRFWWLVVLLTIVINTAVNPTPDSLGLTHIALQPLVLIGFAWLAANAHGLSARWQRIWAIGLACDFIFGIMLQFGVQSLWLDRWLNPGLPDIDYIRQLSQPAAANYYGKLRIGAMYLADGVTPFVALCLIGTTAVLAFLTLRASIKSHPT